MADWRRSLLKRIGAPVTPQNLKFLSTWQRWEGGHTKNDARFNWLNTTKSAPGVVRSVNSVGVKAFDSFDSGIHATALTLMNGRYDDIVGGLKKGNPYKANPSAGLQTWVSGRPDGNPGYAQKVLGGSAAPKAAQAPAGRGPKGNPGLAAPPPSSPWGDGGDYDTMITDIWGDLAPLFRDTYRPVEGMPRSGGGPSGGPESPLVKTGKGFRFPTTPKGTHVSDGLGWGTKTAQDIMGAPGTAVQAPMGGQVVYWHPTGAQGGGSMLIRLDNGREYWLGHIANGVKAGTRFKRGQTLALISPDHRAPHLHIDSRGR